MNKKKNHVKEIKTIYIGAHSLLVNMTIETKPKLNIEYADDEVAEVERRIVKRLNIVLFALYGIYTRLTKGVEKALVADVAPKNFKASVPGMYSMIVGIGLLPASLLTEWLWNEFGAAVPFYFNGGLAVLHI